MNTTKSVIAVLLIATAAFISSCGNAGEKKTEMKDTMSLIPTEITPDSSAESKEAEESHEVDKPGAGPHQGIIEEAGEKNHMEMVIDGKDVNFYPLDDMTNALDVNGWTGKAVFQYKDGTSKNVDLMNMNGMLMATGANTGSFKAVATLTMNGNSISAQFNSEGSMGIEK